MTRIQRAVATHAFLVAAAITSFAVPAADTRPLDQRGHDERVRRERETRERVERETRVQREQDAIRARAQRGGYESDYDKAVDRYAGPRTRESVERSRPRTGAGHTGDHVQPGLTGREGGR
jgi:hypothetical protein